MKKFLLALCMTLCLTSVVFAEGLDIGEILKKFPMKQGVAYSIPDDAWVPISSFSLIKKWGLSGDVGYVGSDKLVVAGFYHLGKLEKMADVPLLKYVDLEVGGYYGLEGINKGSAGEDYGVAVKILEIKF